MNELPPLPEQTTKHILVDGNLIEVLGYSDKQMQAYARAAIEARKVPDKWKRDLMKLRGALDPDDWCGDERMIDVLDRVLVGPCCMNYAAGTNCFADPRADCPLLASAPPAPQASVVKPEPVYQYRKEHCADWYDGFPDSEDGGGPYETRTLYTHPAPVREPLTPEQQKDEVLADVVNMLSKQHDWLTRTSAINLVAGLYGRAGVVLAHGITKDTP